MRRVKDYIRSALYHIRHNMSFAVFYVLGTALTFVFIAIVLQLVYAVIGNEPPLVNADRVIYIDEFEDAEGYPVYGLPVNEIDIFMKGLHGYEACAMAHSEFVDVFTENTFVPQPVDYVNADYWKVFQFNFVEGRAFSPEEYEKKQSVAVITKSMANLLFKNESAIGKKIECQKVIYRITGVVEDFSIFTTEISSKCWLSNKYNTFTPSGDKYYEVYVLFPVDQDMDMAKQEIAGKIKDFYSRRGKEVILSGETLYTVKEDLVRGVGVNLLSYGVWIVLLILLIIPAINIMTLSVANSNRLSEEFAIRKAIGASCPVLFFQMMTENLILVIIGVVFGLSLFFPVVHFIETVCINNITGGIDSLVTKINYVVIFGGILPLTFVFTLLTGGFSAYVAVKRNMAEVLKGGSK